MIAEKCFTQEWINAKAEELRYPDKNVKGINDNFVH